MVLHHKYLNPVVLLLKKCGGVFFFLFFLGWTERKIISFTVHDLNSSRFIPLWKRDDCSQKICVSLLRL